MDGETSAGGDGDAALTHSELSQQTHNTNTYRVITKYTTKVSESTVYWLKVTGLTLANRSKLTSTEFLLATQTVNRSILFSNFFIFLMFGSFLSFESFLAFF